MKQKIIRIFLMFVILFLAGCSATNINPNAVKYGTPLKYEKEQIIEFADFSIKFIGERRTTSDAYPRGFLFYDFEIFKGDKKQTVSWTSGTGEIAPEYFSFNNKEYVLEMEYAMVLKKQMDNEIIIWRKSDYLKKINQ